MTKRDLYNRLLDASPEELAGEGDSPIAEYVRHSPAGRDMAGRFLQAQDELKAELASIRPKSTADEAVDRILAQSSGESQLKGSRSRLNRLKDRPPRHRRWTIAISTTLAAVTCVIGLWVVNQVNVPDSLVDQTPSFSTRTADLRLMTDQNAIIFETSKPDIKVVWLY